MMQDAESQKQRGASLLASPLVASLIVIVRMLCVEDTLGDEVANDDANADKEERA